MSQDVFCLFKSAGGENATFPIAIKEYQRYLFGDDKLAHRFGTDLAKAFVAHGPGFGARKTTSYVHSPIGDIVVAVISGYVPTATHNLRNHFVACLNRHLVSINARPAVKIDINRVEKGLQARNGPSPSPQEAYHIDRERLEGRAVIILGDLRKSPDHENQVRQSLRGLEVDSPIVFVYLSSLSEHAHPNAVSPLLEFVVSPSIKDVEVIVQTDQFVLNECFVLFVLGRDHGEFCQFMRRQDDGFARLLLDYAIGGQYYEKELYQQNVKFLHWEVGTRESV
ncbi:hypothetical protein P153DRAFT_326954 [Dothidotthia symphoricarpi CBS 119687]|uniref:Uncharacterized protein n=1 Tax=Dothidotthia symphoricarpi CBS 119687 TaxID=1392245 RepID=A0A6A5ZZ70_9PLEO|nr:uncharacterized protein P153DRAFT_326954 [Dothidotthia symphoricarpi CBS 119687]KAF2124586.1 hypothetical protein P153DRAFT_326954 [Dothidotthia symphoricarpi CBS 119687]